MNIVEINDSEKDILLQLANKLKFIKPSSKPEEFIIFAKSLSYQLPEHLKDELKNFKLTGHQKGALLFRNMPNDNSVITPRNNKEHVGETTIISCVQAIINEYLGEMVSYEAEGDGYLFQDMVPNEELKDTQTSLGSGVELEVHTEQAFSHYRPDYLSLACIKKDSSAYTYFLHVDQILDYMSANEINYLEKKKWNIGVDMSFALNGCDFALRGPLSILTINNNGYDLNFDQDLLCSDSKTASKLIDKIVSIYKKKRHEYVLQPGEILLLDNHKLIHGRSSFKPLFNGNDRFIVRSFVINDLKKIENKTHGKRMVKSRWS